jgi:hypothetical protein
MPGWIDIKTAAERSGRSAGHLRRLCVEQWAAKGLAKREPHAGQTRWSIREDAHPSFAPVRNEATADPRKSPVDLAALSGRERGELALRERIVLEWNKISADAAASGKSLSRAAKRFLDALEFEGHKLSQTKLYRLVRDFKRSGLAGLMDGRWLTVKSRREALKELLAIATPMELARVRDMIRYGKNHRQRPGGSDGFAAAIGGGFNGPLNAL